jgi:uncharacterized repeat protein (TIGR01451 family)
MKQKLLLLTLLSFTIISFAKPKENAVTGPSIGLLMNGQFIGFQMINFEFSIKNTGDETLTNIQISPNTSNGTISFDFTSIPDLAPGEEITGLHGYKYGQCYDSSQTYISATTLSNVQVTDLSADPYNGGNYYNNNYSYCYYFAYINAFADGVYQDLNNNSLVDVGDAINYNYTITSNDYLSNIDIFNNNATITYIDQWNNGQITAIGIHYITQEEIDYGYVYNSPSVSLTYDCGNQTMGFQDLSYCNCPNPNNEYIITSLSASAPHKISGNVKFNINNDDCATGINFPCRRVETTDGTYNYATYTNNNGDYSFIVPNIGDNYNSTALTGLNNNFTANPVAIATSTLSSPTPIDYNNNNFCISTTTSITDLSVMAYNITQAIPGNSAAYVIYFHNNGTTSLNGSLQFTYNNSKLNFGSTSVPADSSTANTLTWNYSNLLPFQWRYIILSFNVMTPPTVNAGDILAFSLEGTTTSADDNPANNTLNWNQSVVSSFDPNDKTVIEGASIDIAQTGDYLIYVTRFQNTGNANATTVVIKETLDPKLDWNTFEPIDSSHTSNIQIKNGNELTYTFSNIDLPYESANEPASHGWMAYRIKPKADIALWDIMSSKSDIYFDYNLPITTNTATTQVTALATTDFAKNNFKLYPNPAANYFVIEAATTADSNYQIIDLNGKVLQSNTVESMKPIDISNLQSGFYFVAIKTNQGSATYKLIKN